MNKKLLTIAAICFCVGVAALLGIVRAQQIKTRPEIIQGRVPVQVEVVVEGFPKPVYYDGPYRWIEGRAGEHFAFRITNPNSFPVGVIPSADGQSLTADGRASASHPAYVIEPYNSLTVSIWREDLNGGRELVFAPIDQSLAALKGDRRNIGVLGVLVWQLEDRYRPPVPLLEDGRADKKSKAGAPSSAPSSRDSSNAKEEGGIGVGVGGRVNDQAYLTNRFRRVRVLGTVAIYYDDFQGLIRAGVNVNQHGHPIDRRHSDPFPGEYRGVKIP